MSKLKPFDLEAAKAGAKVVTREGGEARIICFDLVDENFPLAVAVMNGEGELLERYSINGKYHGDDFEDSEDLLMAPVKREAWVNVYSSAVDEVNGTVHSSERDAAIRAYPGLKATVKIEWEE